MQWVRSTSESASGMLRLYSAWAWLLAVASGVLTAIAVGIPTGLIQNGWFTRMTPVRVQDYVLWIVSAMLIGVITGSFALGRENRADDGKLASGGALAYIAVGCPVCNKLIVLFIGTSAALSVYGPLQLYIGLGSIVLLGWTFLQRARAVMIGCAVPSIKAVTD